jgi:hypothetical protein
MKRTWTIIGVRDAPASFKWYQSLFGQPETLPAHDYFGQILDTDGTVLLCLHRWGAHEHHCHDAGPRNPKALQPCRHFARRCDDSLAPEQCRRGSAAGEQKANMIRWPAVALRTCTVSFVGPSGVRHAVEVTAESVYEGAALGVSALRNSGWADAIAPGTEAGDSGARSRPPLTG